MSEEQTIVRCFKSGDTVVANTNLRLVRPSGEFGTHIPKGTRGTVVSKGSRQGSTILQVLFHFTQFSGGIQYGAFPVQLKRAGSWPC